MLGLSASVLLGSTWRSKAQEANRHSFESTVADLNDTLNSKLDENIRLTRTMRSIATLEPRASETRFIQWYEQMQRGAPASSDVSAALIRPIPARELPAFRRQVEADAAFRELLGGRFQILPPGKRPVHELQREGCDLVQGFLFARPMAPAALEAFLEEDRGLAGLLEAGKVPVCS